MDPDLVAGITRKHGIGLLLQFGSTVTGHEHPHSDVDLAVEFGEVPESFALLGEAMEDLQSLFPGREVDVAVVNRADPLCRRRYPRTLRHRAGRPARIPCR